MMSRYKCDSCGVVIYAPKDRIPYKCACGGHYMRIVEQEEQSLPAQGKQSVTAALRALLDAREARGIKTYGRSLETFNGRSSPHDLVEELIDGAQYALQWELEREEMIAVLKILADFYITKIVIHEKLSYATARAYAIVYPTQPQPAQPEPQSPT